MLTIKSLFLGPQFLSNFSFYSRNQADVVLSGCISTCGNIAATVAAATVAMAATAAMATAATAADAATAAETTVALATAATATAAAATAATERVDCSPSLKMKQSASLID